jgi:pyruvate/2-oxoglutarate dehydrogenase complex dihydrolipoamide acyltransferase (E2) component
MTEFASEAAEKAAQDANLTDEQLSAIKGSGADDKVTKGDVEAYVESQQAPADSGAAASTEADSSSQLSEEEQAQLHAAQLASVGGAPVPAMPTAAPTEEEVQKKEAAEEVAQTLQDLDHDTLVALRGAVDGALLNKGSEPVVAGPSLEQVASQLPLSLAGAKRFTTMDEVAEAADVPVTEVINFSVRQNRNAMGGGIGPAYLTVVRPDSSKKTVALD